MTQLKLERDIIQKRLEGIQGELKELEELSKQDVQTFCAGTGWKLAQFHLHRALEGVFNITSHILSRIPGAVATQYKEMAGKLGEIGIVDKAYADDVLVKMAGYRNRLVHFYADITPEEVYDIICHHLPDFGQFMSAVKNVLQNPGSFGLEILSRYVLRRALRSVLFGLTTFRLLNRQAERMSVRHQLNPHIPPICGSCV